MSVWKIIGAYLYLFAINIHAQSELFYSFGFEGSSSDWYEYADYTNGGSEPLLWQDPCDKDRFQVDDPCLRVRANSYISSTISTSGYHSIIITIGIFCAFSFILL